MTNEKRCQQCGSNNTKTLGKGYNAVRWCPDCSFEEHTPQVHQKDCEACDQVITLGAPNDEVRFCFDCIEKVEAMERILAEEELTIVHAFYAEPKV